MPKRVTRYRSKKTGRYISKAQWRRNRKTALRQRERYVQGERKTRKSKLRELLDKAKGPVVIRLKYKTRKMRKPVHLEVTYVGGKIKQVLIGRNTYTRPGDFRKLSALINAATPE